MNHTDQDLEAFLIETQLIHQKVKALAENKITPQQIDRLEVLRAEDRQRREDAKQRKVVQASERKRRGHEGKGITKDFSHFCRVCRWEYELETPQCLKCQRRTMPLAQRQAQLEIMVQDYKDRKRRRQERKYKWDMWQKTQAHLWRKSSNNYSKWDFFVSESEEQVEKDPILPKNDPNFKALEMDIEQRKRQRNKDTDIAKRIRDKGNEAMKNGEYRLAIEKYTLALEHIKDIKSIYTNRALAYIKLKKYKKAIKDCDNVIEYMEVFDKEEHRDIAFKAFSRKALAHKEMREYKEASSAIVSALKYFPQDKPAQLLKQEVDALSAHSDKVNSLMSQSAAVESDSEEEEKKAIQSDKDIARQLAEQSQRTDSTPNQSNQIQQSNKAHVDKQLPQVKQQLPVHQESDPPKPQPQKVHKVRDQAPNRMEKLKKLLNPFTEESIEPIAQLMQSDKEIPSLFIAGKGVEKCLQVMERSSHSTKASLLIAHCLSGDGAGQRQVMDYGILKIQDRCLNILKDTVNLDHALYDLVGDYFEILVAVSLFEPYRNALASDSTIARSIEELFAVMISKVKKTPELLSSFLIYFSNLCNGESSLKKKEITKEKLAIYVESIYKNILERQTKSRRILDCKQHCLSLLANLATQSSLRSALAELLNGERFDQLTLQLKSYPRSAHNYQSFIESALSVLANVTLDTGLSLEALPPVLLDRFLKDWQNQSQQITNRSLLVVSRLTSYEFPRAAEWLKAFESITVNEKDALEKDKPVSSHIVRILNSMYCPRKPATDCCVKAMMPPNLLACMERYLNENNKHEALFCNTANLFGIIAQSELPWKSTALQIVKKSMGRLIEFAKDRTGNWRKNAAILMAKASNDEQCNQQMRRLHGMDVLKSVASFIK